MPKPIGSPRTITAVQDQIETVQAVYDIGVGVTYHRRLVTRDRDGVLVGAPGPMSSSFVKWDDLPPNVAGAAAMLANFGDSL